MDFTKHLFLYAHLCLCPSPYLALSAPMPIDWSGSGVSVCCLWSPKPVQNGKGTLKPWNLCLPYPLCVNLSTSVSVCLCICISPHHCVGFLFFALRPPLPRPPALPHHNSSQHHLSHLTQHTTTHHSSSQHHLSHLAHHTATHHSSSQHRLSHLTHHSTSSHSCTVTAHSSQHNSSSHSCTAQLSSHHL